MCPWRTKEHDVADLHGPHLNHLPSDLANLEGARLAVSVTLDLQHKDSIHSFLIGFFCLFLTTCMDRVIQHLYWNDNQNCREEMMTQNAKRSTRMDRHLVWRSFLNACRCMRPMMYVQVMHSKHCTCYSTHKQASW